jgi:hypothetical protein
MARLVDPQSHVMPAVRLVASLAVGLILAAVGGMVLGESLAVQRDMDGVAWPPEGWAAVVLAAVAAAYGIYSAHRVAEQERAKRP